MVDKTDREMAVEQHKEISLTIRRVMFFLLSYSAFCLLTIFQSDVGFILVQQGVKMPIVDINVGIESFLLISPFGLLLINIYLIPFREKLEKLTFDHKIKSVEKIPTLFNLSDVNTIKRNEVIFDFLPLIVFASFLWKTDIKDFDVSNIGISISGLMLLWMGLTFKFHHYLSELNKNTSRLKIVVVIYLTVGSVLVFFQSENEYLPFRGLNLKNSQLENVYLAKSQLSGADLSRSNFSNSNFVNAVMENVNLSYSDLSNSNFREVLLSGANMEGADLTNVDMSDSILTKVNFEGTILKGTILKGADLDYAKNLTQKQLDEACGDNYTNLPTGLTIDMCVEENNK